MAVIAAAWRARLERLFEDAPIAFRSQNGGDYPDRHILDHKIAPHQTGLMVHIAEVSRPASDAQTHQAVGSFERDPRG